MPEIVNFTLLESVYFCTPFIILELCARTQLTHLETLILSVQHESFVRWSQSSVHLEIIIPRYRGRTLLCATLKAHESEVPQSSHCNRHHSSPSVSTRSCSLYYFWIIKKIIQTPNVRQLLHMRVLISILLDSWGWPFGDLQHSLSCSYFLSSVLFFNL